MKYLLRSSLVTVALCAPAFAAPPSSQTLINSSLGHFAKKHEFSGITINVAGRYLPAVNYIMNHVRTFEEYTGAHVNMVRYPENEERSKLVADASSKSKGFDIYLLDNNLVPLFASNNWIQPIGQRLNRYYNVDDIYDVLRRSYSWKNKLYGLPVYSEITLLYYRTDLFKKYHLSPPTTMQDLAKDAQALNHPPRTYGIALRGLRGEGMNVYIWTEWLRSYGARYFSNTMMPEFDSSRAIAATKDYHRLISKYAPPGSGSWGWPQVESAFASGRVAMIVEASAFYPLFNNPKDSSVVGKVGYAVVPAGPCGRFPANFSIGFSVASTVQRNSKQEKADIAFLQWATSGEMEKARLEHGIGNVDRTSVANSATAQKVISPSFRKVVAQSEQLTPYEYRPMIPQWFTVGNDIGVQLEDIFTDREAAKVGLAKAAKQATAYLKSAGVLGSARPYSAVAPKVRACK